VFPTSLNAEPRLPKFRVARAQNLLDTAPRSNPRQIDGSPDRTRQFPPEKHRRIINANLKSGAIEISATDWMAAPEYLPKEGDMFGVRWIFVAKRK
jgi:hypothetical protein